MPVVRIIYLSTDIVFAPLRLTINIDSVYVRKSNKSNYISFFVVFLFTSLTPLI